MANHGISLPLDRGGAKVSNFAASTARIQSRWHALNAYVQHYQTLLQELQGYSKDSAESQAAEQTESGESADTYQEECTLQRFNAACQADIRYPAYDVMCHREEQFARVVVSKFTWFIPCFYHVYTMP